MQQTRNQPQKLRFGIFNYRAKYAQLTRPFVPQREMVKKLWGTDADPLAHKSDWEKRLSKISKQHQFTHMRHSA